MYSDRAPQIVFPDNDRGRFDAAHHRAQNLYVGLCDRFQRDKSPITNKYTVDMKEVCRNREPFGERKHNWCMRCMAGFPVWFD